MDVLIDFNVHLIVLQLFRLLLLKMHDYTLLEFDFESSMNINYKGL